MERCVPSRREIPRATATSCGSRAATSARVRPRRAARWAPSSRRSSGPSPPRGCAGREGCGAHSLGADRARGPGARRARFPGLPAPAQGVRPRPGLRVRARGPLAARPQGRLRAPGDPARRLGREGDRRAARERPRGRRVRRPRSHGGGASALRRERHDRVPLGLRQPRRGHRPREGERIPEQQSSGPVAPDQVVRTLDTDTRAQLAVLLGELRLGTEETTTPLRRALVELGRASEPAAGVADALADRRNLLSRLVSELDQVYTSLGWRRDALTAAVQAGGRTLAVTGRRDAELATALRRLPSTLRALDGALAEVEVLASPLEPALVRLRPAARALRPALVALRE